jgi:cytochrome b pre-mRNA-processing protein 3
MSEAGQPSAGSGGGRWGWRAGRATQRARSAAADQLYGEVVKAARRARWFAELGVPDTPEGRFEMIGLHAALVLRRLRAEGPAGTALAQELFDLMFADIDAALRELGVGDLSVGKQVRRLAGQFYARLAGLEQALGGAAPEALAAALRPVWQGGPAPAAAQVAALGGDLVALERALAALPGTELLRGAVALVPGADAPAPAAK